MAEFVEVMRQYTRMCKTHLVCSECELHPLADGLECRYMLMHRSSAAEEIIMKWAAEHPEKTMKDVLFEKFPNAQKNPDGTPYICVTHVGFKKLKSCVMACSKCWNRPAPEETQNDECCGGKQ